MEGRGRPWTNWAGTYSCIPSSIATPSGEDQIIREVLSGVAAGEKVKLVGSGHSFNDIACTDGRMISLERHDRLLDLDRSSGRVKVEAGISLQRLNEVLFENGLAMQNLGDIEYQSIAGAISTGTHGTGAAFGGLATQVVELELILADGRKLRCSPAENTEIFNCARVGLGALGVISTVTLQCVPAFALHGRDHPMPLQDCLSQLDHLVDTNEHFEFWWFPHTDSAYIRTNNRTHEPLRARGRMRSWLEDILVSNHVLGLVLRTGRILPAAVPRLNRLIVAALQGTDMVDRSDRIFTSPRLIKFSEMEYAIPRQAAADAFREVQNLIDRQGFRVSLIVEVRFVAADDIPLSTAYGRETAYIAVHMYERVPFEEYFRAVEQIMDSFEGRPHWGKIHFQTAETLGSRYPEWDRFRDIRRSLDPKGAFSNRYLDRVLGEQHSAAMTTS